MNPTPVDIQRVRAEISEDVRRRRASGEYPVGFEKQLDLLFARFAPPEVAEDIDDALERAEDAAGIDPEIPTASNNVAFGAVKKVIAKVLGWYHTFLAQQITSFAVALHNVVRRLVEKVRHLEEVTGHSERSRVESERIPAVRDDAPWNALVLDAVRTTRGRVLVAECGDGELLAQLTAAGVDGYGVEPNVELLEQSLARELDVKPDDATTHVRQVVPGDLNAIVLRACVERRAPGELLELVDHVVRALADSGKLVVCSTHPRAWGDARTLVEADLSPGRPLHPETWRDILDRRGFTDIVVHELGAEPLSAIDGANDQLNAQLARISDALFGARSYVLVATRPA